jgi:hypothetical protein
MIFTIQLTPLTVLAPLAVLLIFICWVVTKDYGHGPAEALAAVCVYAGAVFVWLLAAVVVLSLHYFTH